MNCAELKNDIANLKKTWYEVNEKAKKFAESADNESLKEVREGFAFAEKASDVVLEKYLANFKEKNGELKCKYELESVIDTKRPVLNLTNLPDGSVLGTDFDGNVMFFEKNADDEIDLASIIDIDRFGESVAVPVSSTEVMVATLGGCRIYKKDGQGRWLFESKHDGAAFEDYCTVGTKVDENNVIICDEYGRMGCWRRKIKNGSNIWELNSLGKLDTDWNESATAILPCSKNAVLVSGEDGTLMMLYRIGSQWHVNEYEESYGKRWSLDMLTKVGEDRIFACGSNHVTEILYAGDRVLDTRIIWEMYDEDGDLEAIAGLENGDIVTVADAEDGSGWVLNTWHDYNGGWGGDGDWKIAERVKFGEGESIFSIVVANDGRILVSEGNGRIFVFNGDGDLTLKELKKHLKEIARKGSAYGEEEEEEEEEDE